MALSWLLLLAVAVVPVTTGTKVCEFCDMIESSTCTGVSMSCADDEQCFTSYGIIPGLGPIINKGCRLSSACRHLQESVLYKHTTYKLSSSCCKGELCNRVYILSGGLQLGGAPCLVLGMLRLLY